MLIIDFINGAIKEYSMEIGLVFSSKDPIQKEARDSIINFIDNSGMLAKYSELDKKVQSPTLIINGLSLTEKRKMKREDRRAMYPDRSEMLQFIEQHIWCL